MSIGTALCLYHLIRQPICGDWLHPLNRLQELYPEVYAQHMERCNANEQRQRLQQIRIPPLDCFFGDVVFLTPVNPRLVMQALIAAGGTLPKLAFYHIDAESLNPEACTVFLYRSSDFGDEGQYIPYRPELIAAHSLLPERTLRYYQEERGSVFLFAHVPHFMYRDSIPVHDEQLHVITPNDLN